MQKTHVAVIGAGRIGKMHTQLLCNMSGVQVKTVVKKTKIEKEWAQDLGIKQQTQNLDEVLQDNEITAVVIAASTDAHVELIKQCAKAGKHIFCEKPIALSLDVLKEAVETAENNNVKLQVGFNRRFDPHYRAVKKAIVENKIGTPYIVRITNRDPKRPDLNYIPTSGGLFLDFAVHDFDIARYITEDEVVEVYATGGVLVDPEIGKLGDIDTAIITIKFASGAFGVIDCSRETNYGYDQRLEVFGSKGNIEATNVKEVNTYYTTEAGVLGDRPRWSFVERYREAFAVQMSEFIDCVQNDKDPVVTGRDTIKAVTLSIAAEKSFRENRPIEIS